MGGRNQAMGKMGLGMGGSVRAAKGKIRAAKGLIRAAMLAAAAFYGIFLLRALQLAGAADRKG